MLALEMPVPVYGARAMLATPQILSIQIEQEAILYLHLVLAINEPLRNNRHC